MICSLREPLSYICRLLQEVLQKPRGIYLPFPFLHFSKPTWFAFPYVNMSLKDQDNWNSLERFLVRRDLHIGLVMERLEIINCQAMFGIECNTPGDTTQTDTAGTARPHQSKTYNIVLDHWKATNNSKQLLSPLTSSLSPLSLWELLLPTPMIKFFL